MADIICRWRNASAKTVCQFISVLPKEEMSSGNFRDIMENQNIIPDFFRTAYQLACQLGLYYEENGTYFPRFTHEISEEEASAYLSHWIRWYYAPNPYTKSLKANDTPKYLVSELLGYIERNGPSPIREALERIYDEPMGNLDIVINAINNFSQILKIENQIVNLSDNFMNHMEDLPERNNRDLFFKNFEKKNSHPNTQLLDEPLQQIFFGAPGTGKSHRINEMCAEYENYRTTFHPDTDYASFVGSYKPITEVVKKYDQQGNSYAEKRIVYRYVFQSFLKAYIAAWKEQQNPEPKPVFLVIEEINRGNCAQIFGDIFQLLDRNESGYSDYPIVADDDLAQELKRELSGLKIERAEEINALYKGGKDVVGSVKSGEKLLLPNNLYVWATMNTSDQSLFPIDSAFKRRWDWKYIKIKDCAKDYKIVFSNGNEYDWWKFVTAINDFIEGGEIQQEDKKLGYFFAKAKNGNISAERFLSKVIFYLYNDVFKDFGLEEDIFLGEDGKPMTFASYFDETGDTDEKQIERFLRNLKLTPITEPFALSEDEVEVEELDKNDVNSKRKLSIMFPDGTYIQEPTHFESYLKAIEKIGLKEVEEVASEKKYKRKGAPLISKEQYQSIIEDPTYSYVPSGEYFIIKGINTNTQYRFLNLLSQKLNRGLKVTLE